MRQDEILIQQTLLGDERAFAELMHKHHRSVFTVVSYCIGQTEDTEEIIQDVFVKAHNKLASLREPEKLNAWLLQIARHACRDLHRRKRLDTLIPCNDIELPDNALSAEDRMIQDEQLERILQAVDTIHDLDRALIKDFYLLEIPYQNLQVHYGLSYKAITMRILKAKRLIRKKIEQTHRAFHISTKQKGAGASPSAAHTKGTLKMNGRHTYPSNLFPAKSKGKWGYIDRAGKIKIQPQFDRALGFSNGLARVGTGDKHGFIDTNGQIAIPLDFDWAYSFSEGLAAVKLHDKYGYIDPSGSFAIPAQFAEAEDFQEGFAAVQVNGRWGFIDRSGVFVVAPEFTKAWSFSDGLGAVIKGDIYGYVDAEGNLVWWPNE